ncbi:hypothetical protein H9L25_00215, partial [Terrisporobacter mayombei]|nr:hypothetical protein [Terrisporobacter mayombei]
MTITTIFQEVKKTVSSVFGGKKKKSIDIPTAESNPIQQTRDIQSLSESSTSGTTSGDSTTSSTPQITPRYSNNFGGILTIPSLPTRLQTSYSTILNMLKYGINIFQELENRIDKVNNQIKLLDLQMENSVGTKKIKDLQTQNELYAQQCKLQKDLFDVLENQRRAMQGKAPSFGFSIDQHGNLTNYEETLERLESAYENAKKKEENYTGSNETTKKNLAKATEDANKKLSEAKEFSSQYLDLFYNKIPGAEQEWQKLQNSIKENNDEIEKLNRNNKLFKYQNSIEKINNQMDIWNDNLGLLKVKLNKANGVNKINILNQQINASQSLMNYQKSILDNYARMIDVYKNDLFGYGIRFDANNDITNLDEVLNNYQNSSDLEKIKDLIDEYLDIQRDKIPDIKEEYESLNNEIKEYSDEIEKLNREDKLYRFNNAIKELNNEMDKWADKIDLIDVKLDGANGVEKVNLMKNKIEALNKQLQIQSNIINSINSQLPAYQQDLSKYGVQFDKNGDITNYEEILNKYQNSEDLEKITELIDEYIDKVRDELPDAQKEYHELENAIKDVYQEQLEMTKDVEDKLTQIYKKQIEDKIKAIEKQRDAELKILDEKKKAYQAYRDEINYKDDYDDQMKKINKLQKQLENAQRDDSLGGRKKVEELLEQLEEENKKLQEIVQDKIDKDINDTFDKENDRIEDKADKEIEDLENKWTDSKIAELVAQALGSGVFTSIDGEVSSLKDTMLEFTEESGEALGVLGSQIQKELCDKLVVAQDVMDNLPNILDKLNLKDYSARSINMQSGSGARTISIGDTNINISGNANDDVVNKIKEVVKAENEKLIKELYDRS